MASPAAPLAVQARAQLELRRRRASTPAVPACFGEWLDGLNDGMTWEAPHFRAMQARLDAVTRGDVLRWMCNIPIRHGKSEHNTLRYLAYRLERDPKTRILLGSYNQPMADRFSRRLRAFVRRRGRVALSNERDAAREWETATGGGVVALGAGAGAASLNADLIAIDDPIGKREDAESPAHRQRVWDWLTNDLFARCEPHTGILLTVSRWHQDDPGGRIKDGQAGDWDILELPGRAEEDDPLGRAPGALLWPELRGDEWHAQQRLLIGEYGYASLVQQRPRPREGGMFRWGWWQLLDAEPVCSRIIRYWDMAGTEPTAGKNDPDWTAGVAVGLMADGRWCVLDVVRFRCSVGQRDAQIRAQALEDAQRWPGRVQYWLEAQAGISGQEVTDALVRSIPWLPIYAERASGSKVVRAEPVAAQCEAGNVYLAPDHPTRPWRDAFRSEAADFPGGVHDDQVDGLSGAFNKLATAFSGGVTIESYSL